MSQSSSATTLLKAPDLTLKGGLQSVLQSLDVALEDELLRYRNQKQRQAELDKAAEKAKQAQVLAQLKAQADAEALAKKQQALAAASVSQDSDAKASDAIVAVALPEQQSSEEQSPEADAAESSLAIIESETETEGDRDISSTEIATTESSDDGEDDYFASSAALLESLGSMPEEDLEGIKFKSEGNPFLKRLMTPAGVGAALLILAGGSAAGYLMANPSSISHLSPTQLFPEHSADVDVATAQSTAPKAVPAELPPGAPDLTQHEFVDLSLSNLGSIDPYGNPIYSPFKLKSLAAAGTTLAMAPEQSLPSTLPGAAGSTAPGGAATSVPNRVQPVQPSLLAGLSNAVAGRSVAEGLISAKPLPAPIAPAPSIPTLAPAPPAPTIKFQPEQPLPAPAPAPAAAYVAPAPEPYYEAPAEPEPYQEPSYYEAPPVEAADPVEEAPYYEEMPQAEGVEPEIVETPGPVAAVEAEVAPIDPLDIPIPFEPIPRTSTYVVEVPYTSDAVLAEVNELFPNSGAYVENKDSGAVIQVGIYDDAGSAGDAVSALTENGIDAKVENR